MHMVLCYVFFFFKQKTAYEMRISDWSSDVCSSDLNGYCTNKELEFKKRIGKNNKIHFTTKIITYSFKSFNWLHNVFYQPQYNEINEVLYYKKIIPNNIKDYLTQQAIAICIMDDGSRQNSGITIHTNSFTLAENYLLKRSEKSSVGKK